MRLCDQPNAEREGGSPTGGRESETVGSCASPTFHQLCVLVGGRGYFSRHRFELCLFAQLSLSSLLDPLTQQGKDGLGYFLVAGIIYPRSRV